MVFSFSNTKLLIFGGFYFIIGKVQTASDMRNSINKFSALLFLLLGGANCTNNTPKQQENVIITPAPHLKKEVVVQLDKINNKEAKLTIANYLDEPISTNMFVIYTDILVLEFQANDTIREMTCVAPPMRPINIREYDTILAPNAKIETLSSMAVMRECEEIFKITEPNIKMRASIRFRYVNREEEFTQHSNWIIYKNEGHYNPK